MSKKYKSTSKPPLRVEEMPVVSATELKNATGDVFALVSRHRAVAIQRHDKPRAVLLSLEEYKDLTGGEADLLEELKAEFGGMLDDMQSPEQKAAAMRLFEATPEELGEAAVRAAQKKIASGEIKL